MFHVKQFFHDLFSKLFHVKQNRAFLGGFCPKNTIKTPIFIEKFVFHVKQKKFEKKFLKIFRAKILIEWLPKIMKEMPKKLLYRFAKLESNKTRYPQNKIGVDN